MALAASTSLSALSGFTSMTDSPSNRVSSKRASKLCSLHFTHSLSASKPQSVLETNCRRLALSAGSSLVQSAGSSSVQSAGSSFAQSAGRPRVQSAGRRSPSHVCRGSKNKDVDRRAVDKSKILKEDPYGTIEDVMSEDPVCVKADDTLESILEYLEKYTGLPVVDGEGKCVGVISDKDVVKFIKTKDPATDDEAEGILQNKIGECMTKPAITIRKKAAVAYAAGLMLNHKVHRLPVVDKNEKVIGIVTRQDIYEPLMPAVNPLYKARDLDETTLAEWHDLGDY